MTLKEFIYKGSIWSKYLISKWLIIIAFAFIGGFAAFIYAFFRPPVYTATTTFVIEEGVNGGGLGQYGGLASIIGVNIGSEAGGMFQGDNLPELYKSRSMLQKALLSEGVFDGKKQLLISRYVQFRKGHNVSDAKISWTHNDSTNFSFNRTRDSLLGRFVEDIRTNYLSISKPDKNLSIVQVQTKAPDEQFAKVFNDQIVKTVNDFYIQTKTKKALSNLSILQQQTDSVRRILNGAIYNNAAVIDATPNLNPTRQVLRVSAQRSQVNAEANKAILSQLVQNLELSKISLRKETPLIQVLDHPIYPLQKTKLSKVIAFLGGALIFGFLICVFLLVKQIVKTSLS